MIFSHANLLLLLFKNLKQRDGNPQSSSALLQVHQLRYTKNSNDNNNFFIFILLTKSKETKEHSKTENK
jgi:hypothetical protein